MQKEEVKRSLESQEASLALEYKMKQGKGEPFCQEEHTGHSKQPLPTTQETALQMDITRW